MTAETSRITNLHRCPHCEHTGGWAYGSLDDLPPKCRAHEAPTPMTAETVSDEDVERAARAYRDRLNMTSPFSARFDDMNDTARSDLLSGMRAALATDRAARPIDWPRVLAELTRDESVLAARKAQASGVGMRGVMSAAIAAARGKEAGR